MYYVYVVNWASSTIRLEDKLLLIGLSLICNVIAYFTVEYIYKRIDNKKNSRFIIRKIHLIFRGKSINETITKWLVLQ